MRGVNIDQARVSRSMAMESEGEATLNVLSSSCLSARLPHFGQAAMLGKQRLQTTQ